MKRILFIAFIISQVLISTEGVLFAKSENVLTLEQEAKEEIIDEPEILERLRERIALPVFYSSLSCTYSVKHNSFKVDVSTKPDFLSVPLFILQRSLRT